MYRVVVSLITLFCFLNLNAQPKKNWNIYSKNEIHFDLTANNLPYSDNIEMAGKRVAGIVSYSIDKEGQLELNREVFFPQLHQFKSETDSWFHDYRAYFQDEYSDKILPKLYINNERFVPGALQEVSINGLLNFKHKASKSGLELTRSLFPSMDERMFVEVWTLKNINDTELQINSANTEFIHEDYGAKGKYSCRVISNAPSNFTLTPDEEISFCIRIMAKITGENYPDESVAKTLQKRADFITEMKESLQLETPNKVLNTLFEFSKIRAAESIFESELGLIHSPGGGRYYVGIWANDQAEYINPFFPYLGYDIGNESAMNTFRAFAKETNPEFNKIRYSFEIEGLVEAFYLDRGDAAMIAYGATHYALALGNEKIAVELWPLIDWCLEYCNRQLNTEGVVMSESDEMEGRIETGNANLSTSSLYYGALHHAVDLAKSLNKTRSLIRKYQKQAKNLENAIESYFGANIEGLDTYKYYKEHRHLRHWICLPLVVGINKRKNATIEALFERLWTDNGVHVEKNSENKDISKIFWDRGTLYALRGTFFAGETEKSLEKLIQFSEKRLLGDRVPYVVEAYPEGNMAHLSAESALYCRVFTEGLFGIVPKGFKSFEITPRLPSDWDEMALKNVKAFGEDFDIQIRRKKDQINVKVVKSNGAILLNKNVKEGAHIRLQF